MARSAQSFRRFFLFSAQRVQGTLTAKIRDLVNGCYQQLSAAVPRVPPTSPYAYLFLNHLTLSHPPPSRTLALRLTAVGTWDQGTDRPYNCLSPFHPLNLSSPLNLPDRLRPLFFTCIHSPLPAMATLQGPVAKVQAQSFRQHDIPIIKTPIVAQRSGQNRYLAVSPYLEQEHLLDLQSLNDVENQLLALALTNMKCLRDDYATAPYTETFNWGEIIEGLQTLVREINHTWKKTSFYVVAFRSQIPPTTVYAELGTLDKAAHAEATASGGFLKYPQPHLQHWPEAHR